MALAPHRLVWMSLWLEAPVEQDAALTREVAVALAPFGRVTVTSRGPYRRTPELLSFDVELVPSSSTTDCLLALGLSPDEDGDWPVWERTGGGVFLHPAVRGAQVGEEEAATPPPFENGDVVTVLDSPTAREEGLVGVEAVVHSSFYLPDEPDPLLRRWRHQVMPEGREMLEPFESAELRPTGRREVVADVPDPVYIAHAGPV
ncbi:hypothetical protein ACFVTF_22400 [Kitasatospora sp. NPDC057940]|uniref:hypothetical protein n=1 Tax=Kitasatospora sp. NPDC057940 TaxID=3346285 RepID=UPI0036DF79B1